MNTSKELDFYKSITQKRSKQADSVYDVLKDHFKFENIECIETGASQNLEDGCFGLYLAKIVESKGGSYHSVDIYDDIVNKSKLIFEEYIPGLKVNHYTSDSVKFLEEYKGSPNLVHLDSWDLDLTNPIRSMLHGWLEFVAIKDKMVSGSIIIVDDNFLKGTWVNWNEMIDGQYTNNYKKIDIEYDIIGKGSLIYHWCQKQETDWDLIGNHYNAGDNIKIILKKR
jgi:hypothetical protein